MLLLSPVMALLVKLFEELFPFPFPDDQVKQVKESAIRSLIIIFSVIIIGSVYVVIFPYFSKYLSTLGITVEQSSIYILFTVIVIWAVLHHKESLPSIGITKVNLIKSCILGLLLGIVFCVLNQFLSKTNQGIQILSVESLIMFLQFIFVGFGEEIIFRGYLQSRLVAWLGLGKGLLITAIIFSFFHLPNHLIMSGMNFQSSLINCLRLIPISLLFGYIMIKTKNIVSGSILHTVIDWAIQL
ncbi:MAG: Abortive infection protein [Herbinix sp.]|jgi:membrane protease YdiL (CAAX protease family)|nr:Abortive infection protein [Herbinix sp.]